MKGLPYFDGELQGENVLDKVEIKESLNLSFLF